VVLFASVTVTAAHEVGIPVRDPHGSWLRSRVIVSFAVFLVLVLVDAGVRTRRRGWSLRRTLHVLRHRWTPRRLTLAISALLAYYVVYFCYHNLKSWVVFHQPRDDLLQQWDRWLFLGHSPAVLLHALLGQNVAAYVLMAIYMSFSTVVLVSVVAALVFTGPIRHGYVFISSAIWVWILGVGSYYLIPSLGPFSSTPQQFTGLPPTMTQEAQAHYLAQRAQLLTDPLAPDATAQIAAFASLHVAVICLIVLLAHYYRLRRATRAMFVYLLGTVLATVYLGWHYVVDVAAGLAIALAALALGLLTVYPRLRRRPLGGNRRMRPG
jgi:membrane-associated phospholipid phosphatase